MLYVMGGPAVAKNACNGAYIGPLSAQGAWVGCPGHRGSVAPGTLATQRRD